MDAVDSKGCVQRAKNNVCGDARSYVGRASSLVLNLGTGFRMPKPCSDFLLIESLNIFWFFSCALGGLVRYKPRLQLFLDTIMLMVLLPYLVSVTKLGTKYRSVYVYFKYSV